MACPSACTCIGVRIRVLSPCAGLKSFTNSLTALPVPFRDYDSPDPGCRPTGRLMPSASADALLLVLPGELLDNAGHLPRAAWCALSGRAGSLVLAPAQARG